RVAEMAAFSPLGGSLHRDAMMALNVKWLLDQNPGGKAALWVHNYHVSRTAGAQGSYIANWYPSDYVVLGLLFTKASTMLSARQPQARLDRCAPTTPPYRTQGVLNICSTEPICHDSSWICAKPAHRTRGPPMIRPA